MILMSFSRDHSLKITDLMILYYNTHCHILHKITPQIALISLIFKILLYANSFQISFIRWPISSSLFYVLHPPKKGKLPKRLKGCHTTYCFKTKELERLHKFYTMSLHNYIRHSSLIRFTL